LCIKYLNISDIKKKLTPNSKMLVNDRRDLVCTTPAAYKATVPVLPEYGLVAAIAVLLLDPRVLDMLSSPAPRSSERIVAGVPLALFMSPAASHNC